MSTKTLHCPNCGADEPFSSPGTVVIVCSHCSYASYRRDVALESIGKVAMPAELESHFALGTRGRHEGRAFVVRGQLQLDHGAGPWNEWCASTEDGGWLWIAEAQGRVAVLRECAAPPGLPRREAVRVGGSLRLDDGPPFVVSELGEATVVAAAGALPIALAPGARTRYADLSRPGSGFATIDWTRAEPEVFVGRQLELAALELDPATQPEARPSRVAARRIACKSCGAALELFDPANARTVTCSSCNAILDPRSEHLVAKQAQERLRTGPCIALGLVTRFRGEELRVLGFLRRAVTVERRLYPWSEYLLRTSQGEYRWLVENNGHWIYATPIDPGAVRMGKRTATYEKAYYRHFDGGKASVRAVLGEFYWQVRVDDQVEVADYVAGPCMVSLERDEKERVASASVHVEPGEVAQAFGVRKMPARKGVGPLQPNPHDWQGACKVYGLALVALLALLIVRFASAEKREVLAARYGPVPTSPTEEKVDFSEPFELTAAHANARVSLSLSSLDNGWLGVDGAFVNESTGAVTSFAVATEHYHGFTDGENWDEGGLTAHAWVGPLPAGRYRLRLAGAGYEKGLGQEYSVRVLSDVPHGIYFLLAAALLVIVPVLVSVLGLRFERARWENSAHPWGEGDG